MDYFDVYELFNDDGLVVFHKTNIRFCVARYFRGDVKRIIKYLSVGPFLPIKRIFLRNAFITTVTRRDHLGRSFIVHVRELVENELIIFTFIDRPRTRR